MSVFQSILPGIFGPPSSSAEELASKLEEWIGLRRRARSNMRAFYDLKNEMVDWSGPIPADLVARMQATETQLTEADQQFRAYDEQILGLGQQAVDAGKVDVAALDDYRRRLYDAAGLGLIGPLIMALTAGIVLVSIASSISIVYLAVQYGRRANDAAAVQNAGLRDAWEISKQQAIQQGRGMQTPPAAADASKGSPLVSVGVGAGGVGLLLAAVGGLLLLNSRGGRRT